MQEKRDGDPVISGECRVEAISPTGQALLLNGLRLRLDLHLKAHAATDTAPGLGHASVRFETDRLHALVARTPAYQLWSVLAGVATLALASSIWIWGGATAPPNLQNLDGAGPGALPALTTPPPRANGVPEAKPPVVQPVVADPASAVVVAPVVAPRLEPPAAAEGVLPPPRARTTEGALRATPPTPASGGRAPVTSHPAAASARPNAARATAGNPQRTSNAENSNAPSSTRASAPTAANSDLLDLFSDTK